MVELSPDKQQKARFPTLGGIQSESESFESDKHVTARFEAEEERCEKCCKPIEEGKIEYSGQGISPKKRVKRDKAKRKKNREEGKHYGSMPIEGREKSQSTANLKKRFEDLIQKLSSKEGSESDSFRKALENDTKQYDAKEYDTNENE